MNNAPAHRIRRLIGLVAAILGASMVYVCAYTGIPPRSDLGSASGAVDWVDNRRFHVAFGLAGDKKTFHYPRKAGSKNEVARELRQGQEISLLYGPADWADRSHPVYEISGPGALIRSYNDIQSNWETNQSVGVWFGAFFCLLGALLLFKRVD